jgi:type I restriction enzyme, S subunit
MKSIMSWKENLPNSWEVKPLKSIALYYVSNVDKIASDSECPVMLCNYTDVYKNDFISLEIEFMESTASAEEISKFGLKIGDIIITKDSESWDDIAVPALVIESSSNLVCGYHLAIIRPKHDVIFSPFLFRCFQSKLLRTQLELASTGVTRYGLPKDEIGKMVLPIPDLNTQRSIASYLDRETALIDSLITAKERQLVLLAEKRQALMTSIVTRGLDPNVNMKDSRVEWLGKVPEKWEVKYLKYAAILRSGENLKSEDMSDDGEFPVYGGNGYRGMYHEHNHEGHYILIGRQGALCGNINYAEGKFWATEHAVVVTIIDGSNTIYLGELLRIMNINQYSVSAAQPGLSVEVISNLKIPSPPISEQNEIVTYLQKETFTLDALQAATNRSIGLLKERRAALISAVVTGQFDIQNNEN